MKAILTLLLVAVAFTVGTQVTVTPRVKPESWATHQRHARQAKANPPASPKAAATVDRFDPGY